MLAQTAPNEELVESSIFRSSCLMVVGSVSPEQVIHVLYSGCLSGKPRLASDISTVIGFASAHRSHYGAASACFAGRFQEHRNWSSSMGNCRCAGGGPDLCLSCICLGGLLLARDGGNRSRTRFCAGR